MEELIAMISFLSSLSLTLSVSGSDERLKKHKKTLGTRCWCFSNHRGVMSPSGYSGDPGDKGERGECRVEPYDVVGDETSMGESAGEG